MAQTKKTTVGKTTKKGSAKAKSAQTKYEVIPEFFKEFETGNGVNVELSLYERDGKADSIKLVIGDAFIIYGHAIVVEDYAFLSYPSFKSGDKFINQVFCIDKELNELINDALSDYYFND